MNWIKLVRKNVNSLKPKLLSLLLPLLLFVQLVMAQQVDSLEHAIKAHTTRDTIRVRLILQYATAAGAGGLNESKGLVDEAMEIASSLNYYPGVAKAHLTLGEYYANNVGYEKAEQHFRAAAETYKQLGNIKAQAKAIYHVANVHYSNLKFGKAIDLYKEAISLSEQAGDVNRKGYCYTRLGGVYRDMGKYPKAIEQYLIALRVMEKAADKEGISEIYGNMATVYLRMNQLDKALDYLQRGRKIDEEINNTFGVIFNNVNTGIIYGEKKDYKTALSYFKVAYELADSQHDEFWKNATLANIAEVYFLMGDYEQAFASYSTVLTESKKLKEMHTTAAAYIGIGRILLRKGKNGGGIDSMTKGFELAKQVNSKQLMFEGAREISFAYENVKKYKEALEYYKLYFDCHDSLHNESGRKEIEQLQFEYELDKKEAQIKILEQNKTISQSKSQAQRIVLWAQVAVILLFIVIMAILYRNSKREQRSREEISKQKEEIQAQATSLQELNHFKDKTFSVLSHDLRGPLNSFSSMVAMLDADVISQKEFNDLKPEVSKQLDAINFLVDNMLAWARIYMKGEIAAKPELMDVKGIVSRNIALLHGQAGKKDIKMHNNIADGISAYADPNQMDIVIRNLIANAIKFTPRGGAVTLSAEMANGVKKIVIADTGVGMSQERIKQLFLVAGSNTSYGTDGEKGTGLGLLLCNEFVRANNGKIEVTSELGKGTTFTIHLPASV